MSQILGIDFGTKKIGLAISDEDRLFALPLKTITNVGEQTLHELANLIKLHNISLTVIGIPYHQNGATPMQKKIEDFCSSLQSMVPELKIKTINENLSSQQARQNLKNRKNIRFVDAEAARIFLQDFLDSFSN